MRYYFFSIKENRIDQLQNEPLGKPVEYQYFDKSFGAEQIYFRIAEGKIINVMCFSIDPKAANKAVDLFLAGL